MSIVRQIPFRALALVVIPATLLLGSGLGFAQNATDQPGAAGMRVYRDPVTGTFTAPPTDAAADALANERAVQRQARESATGGPAEQPGTSAAGGVTMDLRGRFQSDTTATIGADGAMHLGCERAGQAR
ncbi:MAG TPA: hypothetical protein VGK30_21050 [Candidatus Binatia bacterium]|jgi:hypothetical protein